MAPKIEGRAKDEDKHSYDVNTLLYHRGALYSGADDGKIIVWDKNLVKKGQVVAHPCSIYSLAAIGDSIYSCSNEGTVKSWSLDLKLKKNILRGDCEFWKLGSSNGILYVGDDQGILRTIKDDELKEQYIILEGFKDMAIKGNMVFSAKDLDVIVVELSESRKHSFVQHKNIPGRAPLCLTGGYLVFTGRSAKDIYVHENDKVSSYKEVTVIKDAHEMIINALMGLTKGDDVFLYSAGWDKNFKEWKMDGTTCSLTNQLAVDVIVNTMVFDEDGNVFVAGGDGNILKLSI